MRWIPGQTPSTGFLIPVNRISIQKIYPVVEWWDCWYQASKRLLWWHRIIYFVIKNAMCNYMHLLGNGHPEKEKNERKSCSMVIQRIDENLFILHGRPKFELFAVCSSRYQTQMGSLIKLWKGNHLSPWSLQQTSINTQRMIIYSLPLFPFRLLLGTWTLPHLLSEKAIHALPMAVSVAL
jgi:hypothetical protein